MPPTIVKITLIALAAATFLTGPVAFFAPQMFYDSIPGLSLMGPFNLHFIRDVGLAFAASGGCVMVGTLRCNRELAIAGALWPFLHGLFHAYIWFARGLLFDGVAAFNIAAVILPALLMMALALQLRPKSAHIT